MLRVVEPTDPHVFARVGPWKSDSVVATFSDSQPGVCEGGEDEPGGKVAPCATSGSLLATAAEPGEDPLPASRPMTPTFGGGIRRASVTLEARGSAEIGLGLGEDSTTPNKCGAQSESLSRGRRIESAAAEAEPVRKRLRGKQPAPAAAVAVGETTPGADVNVGAGEAVRARRVVVGDAECAHRLATVRPRVVKRPAAEGSEQAGRGQEPQGSSAKVHRSAS